MREAVEMLDHDPEEDRAKLYTAIGSAITAWVKVEDALAEIFQACLNPSWYVEPDGGPAEYLDVGLSTVMETTESFRARLALIDAAMERVLSGLGPEGERIGNLWARERKKLSGPAGNRNKLAHWNVQRMVNDIRLVPPRWHSDSRGYFNLGKEGFTASDVAQWELSFDLAANRLQAACRELGALPELRRKLLEPAASLMRKLARHDPTELSRLKRVLSFPD
ncbi:MAG: hypothetical protein WBL20_24250 [Sphingobium sp.]